MGQNLEEYTDRKTAKAVVVNDSGEVLLFPHSLIGGGIEGNETYEEALHREALEEAGIQIEIIKPVGEVIGFHDGSKLKYIVHGYLCKYIAKVADAVDELDHPPRWENPEDAINRIQANLDNLLIQDVGPDGEGMFQSRVANRHIAICFLNEAFKK